jgi:hypothetical protein
VKVLELSGTKEGIPEEKIMGSKNIRGIYRGNNEFKNT